MATDDEDNFLVGEDDDDYIVTAMQEKAFSMMSELKDAQYIVKEKTSELEDAVRSVSYFRSKLTSIARFLNKYDPSESKDWLERLGVVDKNG